MRDALPAGSEVEEEFGVVLVKALEGVGVRGEVLFRQRGSGAHHNGKRGRARGPAGFEDGVRGTSDGGKEIRVVGKGEIGRDDAFAVERGKRAGVDGGHVVGSPVEKVGDFLPEDGEHGPGILDEGGHDDVRS